MTERMTFKVAPTLRAPDKAITRVEPKLLTDCSKCEGNVNIGFFFDGTGNNLDIDTPELKHSNIARLFDTYSDKYDDGYYRRYIPGVGTPFPAIGEKGESALGSGFAIGCEQRVLFGLLWVFNSLHRAAFDDQYMFDDTQVKALCCNHSADYSAQHPDDIATLRKLGLSTGLRMPDFGGEGNREVVLKHQAKLLEEKLVRGKPRIKECFIDVFGFSRGAAEARVFCQWLDRLIIDGKFAGTILHLRFVGLMDTVASAGFWSSSIAGITGLDGGHAGWAGPEFLRIPPSVQNCVHMVAMHELRRNFPLDTITVDGVLPPHCQEFAYPGAHSDIGGGYRAGELGVSVGKSEIEGDGRKLSQIPLNHMFSCAIAAGAPMKKEPTGVKGTFNPFSVDPKLLKAFEAFLALSTMNARAMHEWLQPYLNWRWEIHKRYLSQGHVQKANESDQKLLVKFNNILISDAALLSRTANRSILRTLFDPFAKRDALAVHLLDKEAQEVLAIAQAASSTETALHAMFDGFVHDSLAGFDRASLELTGYWRYRKGFLGSRKSLIANNDGVIEKTSNTA